MKGIVYHGPQDFRVEQVEDPKLQGGKDALVRVSHAAICGSDLHFWHGPALPFAGFTMGHEFVGLVEEVGSGVSRFRKGDRVLAACTVGCGECASCRRGLWSGCVETTKLGGPVSNVYGNPLLPGGQAEAVRVPFADVNLFPIPEALSEEQALLLTDAAPTGYMGAQYAEIASGDVVVVFGCGPVGAFAQRAAGLRGAATVVAVDLDDARLARARARGCVPVNPAKEDLLERVHSLSDGRGADAVIEAVGHADLIRTATQVARPGAHIAAIGVVMPGPLELPYLEGMFAKSLTLRSGLVSPQAHVPELVALVEQGRLDLAEVVTHRLPLAEGVEAYRLFADRADGVLKVVLEP